MILSEKDAMLRWCPQAISLFREYNGSNGHAIAGVNRDTPQGNIPACIASHCLFWRWAEPKKIRDIDLVTSDVEETAPRTGYCGIAGRPEFD